MKKTKNKYSKTMLIPIIFGLILYVLFKNADSKFEQLLVGFLFFTNLIPFVIHLVIMLMKNTVPPVPKEQRSAEYIIAPVKTTSSKKELNGSIKKFYKAKTNDNVFYIDIRNKLITVVQKGNLDRDSILNFKLELDNRLGINRYAYKDFDFENDMHEIYVKLKSSKLTDDDYDYLNNILKDLVS